MDDAGQKNVVFKDHAGNGVDNYRPIYHVYRLYVESVERRSGFGKHAQLPD